MPTLTIELPEEVRQRLEAVARERGQEAAEVAGVLLARAHWLMYQSGVMTWPAIGARKSSRKRRASERASGGARAGCQRTVGLAAPEAGRPQGRDALWGLFASAFCGVVVSLLDRAWA